jgi:hypothetical protein
MNSKHKLFILIALMSIIFYGILEYRNFINNIELHVKSSYDRNKQNFESLINVEQRIVEAIALTISTSEIVKKSYNEDNETILKEFYLPLINKLQSKDLVYEMHFFSPPANSFANLSNISASRDDVSKVRTDVVHVSK